MLLPHRPLSTLANVALLIGAHTGVIVGAGVALFGWPALWILRWEFGLSPEYVAGLISSLSNDYVTVAGFLAVGFVLVTRDRQSS